MDSPNSILLLQLKRAGDLLVATPVLPALKAKYPGAALDVLTDRAFAPLLEGNPCIRSVRIYDRENPWKTLREVREARYGWIFDFQSSPRSALVVLLSNAKLSAGFRVPFWGRVYNQAVRRPGGSLSVTEGKFSLVESITGPLGLRAGSRVFLSEAERAWAAAAMAPGNRNIIGLVPTHRRDSRRWPAKYFAQLAEDLLAEGLRIWIFWGPGEEEYAREVASASPGAEMIPPTSFRQMAALFERCRLVVTNDNGPMHLAVAVDTPTLTIYGPTDPSAWNPGGSVHRFIRLEGLSCLGCNLNECPFGHECMEQLSPEAVHQAVREAVGRLAAASS